MKRPAEPGIFHRIEDALGPYIEQHPKSRDILELFGGLIALERESMGDLDVALPKDIDVEGLLEKGFPVLGRSGLPVDMGSAKKLFATIVEKMASANVVLEGACRKVAKGVEDGFLDFEGLAGEFLREDFDAIKEAAAEADADPWVLMVFIRAALGPSIAAASEIAARLLPDEGWHELFCPVCGSRPAVAVHSKEGEGRRDALCSLCAHAWRIDRISCAFCNTKEQKNIRYFHVEDDAARRVYLCDECKSYLKVFEERDLPEWLEPILEDLVTPHLDEAAEGEGYLRPAPRLLGI
jgi:FdhE protein